MIETKLEVTTTDKALIDFYRDRLGEHYDCEVGGMKHTGYIVDFVEHIQGLSMVTATVQINVRRIV